MIADLLTFFLIFIGGIALLISLIIGIIGLITKSSISKVIALIIAAISLGCFGIIYFWYLVVVPSSNQNIIENYAGTYSVNTEVNQDEDNSQSTQGKFILRNDSIFIAENMEDLGSIGIIEKHSIDDYFELIHTGQTHHKLSIFNR